MKNCSKCKKELKLNQFNKDKYTKDGLCHWCKNCQKEENQIYRKIHKEQIKKYRDTHKKEAKEYYEIHKEEIHKKQKIYRENHKKQMKQLTHNHYLKHRKIIIKKQVEYDKNRYKVNINFRIATNLRRRIRLALKGNPKIETSMKLVGCSIEKLKEHLEKQFKSGMSWANYGKNGWVIDHIKSCASFNLFKPKEQRKCFNYKNLQPLWAEENENKGR